MNGFELCAILAATEADVQPGTWDKVQAGQKAFLDDMLVWDTGDLQQIADWCHWAVASTECIEMGLMTGPKVHKEGAEQIITLAKARGLVVPLADVREGFFKPLVDAEKRP